MTRGVLVLRPEPGASETAARATDLGLAAVTAPLFTVRALDWTPGDAAGPIVATSANAFRHGGPALAGLTGRRVYAVGEATARAARRAGFADIVTGAGDAAALLPLLRAEGVTRALHLAGADHVALGSPGLTITTRIVYAAEPVTTLPAAAAMAIAAGHVALIHSPRAGRLFARLVGDARGAVRIAAISPAARSACGPGWASLAVAPAPRDDALLAAAAGLCDQACRNGDDGDEDHGRDRG